MEFELLVWGDGAVRLTFEDRLEGNDIVFTLGEDGQARYWDGEDGEPVNLVAELRKLALARQAPAPTRRQEPMV